MILVGSIGVVLFLVGAFHALKVADYDIRDDHQTLELKMRALDLRLTEAEDKLANTP